MKTNRLFFNSHPFKREVLMIAALAVGGFFVFQPQHLSAQVTFGAKQINAFSMSNAGSWSAPAFADLDNDGDLDLISGNQAGSFVYQENTGTATAPTFGTAQTNPFGLTTIGTTSTLTFGDLDNDGDIDIMAATMNGGWSYFQNTGTASAPAFAAAQTNPFGLTSVSLSYNPSLGDIDNDGDLDLITGVYSGTFYYFQNTGTASAPAYAAAQMNPFSLTNNGGELSSPELGDLDNDGDLDLITGENSGTGNIHYYENTGTASSPTFGAYQTNPFSLTAVGGNVLEPAFADLDGDGDLDLVFGNTSGDLHYYQNNNPTTDVDEYSLTNLNVYPNPTNGIINVSINSNNAGVINYTITAIDGKIIKQGQHTNGNNFTIDLGNESKGVYLFKMANSTSVNVHRISKL